MSDILNITHVHVQYMCAKLQSYFVVPGIEV